MVTWDVPQMTAPVAGRRIAPQRSPCPVCGSAHAFEFLHRGNVPVFQHLVLKDQRAAVNAARAELNFVCCNECGFVFNTAFDPLRMNYDTDYDNSQMHSHFFQRYIETMVQYLLTQKGVRNCRIVEVGCGNGQFLRMLVENDAGNTGVGFDPAYAGPEVDLGGRLRFQRSLYGPESAATPADVVICRHVIEHVPDPSALIQSVRAALAASPSARVFFETPAVDWIFRKQVIWDFFYEHVSLFSRASLSTLFEHGGFEVLNVRPLFGGQYLWLEATPSERRHARRGPGDLPRLARRFGVAEPELRAAWQARIRDVAGRERLAIWGAGAKGATFANLTDPHRELITCAVDINPHKQGGYLPGTGHPIVDYRVLEDLGVTTAVLMNPNYGEEVRGLLHQAGLDVGLVELHNR